MHISDEVAETALRSHFTHVDFSRIPQYMLGGIGRYLMWGVRPGGFLEAVFTNDFKLAVTRADSTNSQLLKEYAYLVFNLPGGLHGSVEVYERWIEIGGLEGRCKHCGFPGGLGHDQDCPDAVK